LTENTATFPSRAAVKRAYVRLFSLSRRLCKTHCMKCMRHDMKIVSQMWTKEVG
jgi:hypothetical protein